MKTLNTYFKKVRHDFPILANAIIAVMAAGMSSCSQDEPTIVSQNDNAATQSGVTRGSFDISANLEPTRVYFHNRVTKEPSGKDGYFGGTARVHYEISSKRINVTNWQGPKYQTQWSATITIDNSDLVKRDSYSNNPDVGFGAGIKTLTCKLLLPKTNTSIKIYDVRGSLSEESVKYAYFDNTFSTKTSRGSQAVFEVNMDDLEHDRHQSSDKDGFTFGFMCPGVENARNMSKKPVVTLTWTTGSNHLIIFHPLALALSIEYVVPSAPGVGSARYNYQNNTCTLNVPSLPLFF